MNDVLLKLAERCEREKATWTLCVDIEIAITPDSRACDGGAAVLRGLRVYRPPEYAFSIDAAARLVPDDHVWRIGSPGWAVISAPGVFAQIDGRHMKPASAALALCAAALRARAAL